VLFHMQPAHVLSQDISRITPFRCVVGEERNLGPSLKLQMLSSIVCDMLWDNAICSYPRFFLGFRPFFPSETAFTPGFVLRDKQVFVKRDSESLVVDQHGTYSSAQLSRLLDGRIFESLLLVPPAAVTVGHGRSLGVGILGLKGTSRSSLVLACRAA
jgi:hypothetical protein